MDDISTVAAAWRWIGTRRANCARSVRVRGVAADSVAGIAAEEAILGRRWNEAAVERVQIARTNARCRSAIIGVPPNTGRRVAKSLVDKFLWERRRRRLEDCRTSRSA